MNLLLAIIDIWQLCTQTESCKGGDDFINILTSKDIENIPLQSWM